MNRREFFISTLGTAAGIALVPSVPAVEPFKRRGPARLQLSLAAYSFRNYFKNSNHARDNEPASDRRIDMFEFLDYCAEQGTVGAELTSYYFPKDVSEDDLLQVRRHAFLRGVAVSGTAVGNTFTHPPGEKRNAEIASVKKWIDHAALLSAPHIRVFAGNVQRGTSAVEAKQFCISALEECAEYAGRKGIFLGIENHGGIVAEAAPLLEIVQAVRSPWVGINLDTGNFRTDDPYGDIARCAPYAVNVQFKAELRARTGPSGQADLGRLVKILRDNGYQGYFVLEYESKEDPWTAVPRILRQIREALPA